MTGVMWFHRKSPGGGCGRPKARVLSMFELLRGCNSQEVAVTCQDKTSRDLTWWEVTRKWHHFTGSHLEVAVEGLKLWFCLCLSSYGAATPRGGSHVTVNDIMWPHVTWKWPEATSCHRKSSGSGCRMPKTRVLCTFDLLQGCNSQVAVPWQEMTSRDVKWPEVTRKWRHFTCTPKWLWKVEN